jgi:hypothetical protein
MPRSDFDVITGPPAPIRPIPPVSLPASAVPTALPKQPSDQSRSDSARLHAPK